MRYIILFILPIFSSLLGCHKEESNEFDNLGRGKGYALKNGMDWDIVTYAYDFKPHQDKVNISLGVIDSDGITGESLKFLNTNLSLGSRQINKMDDSKLLTEFGVFYSTFVDDGDVFGDRFYSPESKPQYYLNIESYDKGNGEIYATFDCVVVGSPSFDLSLPDTLHFEEGWFRVKIVE